MEEQSTKIANYVGPSFADLPTEIIIKLFDHLHATDLKAASQTCRRWYYVSQDYRCQSKMKIKFQKVYLSDNVLPLSLFLKSDRYFTSISFEQTDMGSISSFLKKFGENIEEITFNAVDITSKQFREILESLKNLNVLTIANCSALFMAGQLFDFDAHDLKTLCKALLNVKSLSLPNNRYLSDAILYRITTMTPNIEELSLSNCQIAFHQSLYQRFYPKGKEEIPSESIQTFRYILKIINSHVETLRALDLSETLIGNSAMNSLCKVDGLKLRKLVLKKCAQLTRSSVTDLLQTQKATLKYLDLSHSDQVNDSCAQYIAEQLKELEVLKLSHCRCVTDSFIENITKMEKLKVLDLSNCSSLTINAVNTLQKKINLNMDKLYLSATNISESFLIICTENFPNLSTLDIGYCYNCVTDAVLQSIIKNLQLLKELTLEYCNMITDAALTSINVSHSNPSNTGQKFDSDHFHKRSCSFGNESKTCHKISLRSKAEQEIIDDANRKKMMFAIFEHEKLVDQSLLKEYSIKRLQGLRYLNLSACSKISDVSLIYGFRFRELKFLSLSNCQQISQNGIQYLVKNCPSIEELHLANCHNINDKAIQAITINLKRLTILVIDCCIKLTDHSLDHIAVNCTSLKELSVRGCRLMCSEPNIRVTNLTHLRTIHTDSGIVNNLNFV